MNEINGIPSLKNFPKIPKDGFVTVAESHAEFHSVVYTAGLPINGRDFYPEVASYNVYSKNELTARLPFKIPSIKVASNRKPIIDLNQGISKACWDAWWDGGLCAVSDYLSKLDNSTLGGATSVIVRLISTTSSAWLTVAALPAKVYAKLYPHVEWKTEDIHETFSHIRGWKESWVRGLSWHPNAPLLAIALNDDSVRLSYVGHEDVPMLRCPEQVNVSCISWRPLITTEIAVGCDDCIVVWYLASTNSRKQTKDKTEILKVEGHCPISCVEYSADGIYLISSSAKDATVYIWQTFMWDKAPLRRISGGGIPLALFSPRGGRFLASSPTNVFWIWNLNKLWECKRWFTPRTMIEAACWNPEGSVLLFATGGIIYGLYFELSPVDQFISQTDSIVKPLFNIEEGHVWDENEKCQYKIGGQVRHMEWDPSGQRVAVLFDDSQLVAVFRVAVHSKTEPLVALGYIRGDEYEYPVAISFQKNFRNGALLTIAWNSERIQYFPMIFALPTGERNMLHEDNYRDQYLIYRRPSTFSSAGFSSPRAVAPGIDAPTPTNASSMRDKNEFVSPNRLYSVLAQAE